MKKVFFMVFYFFLLMESCLYAFSNSDFKVSAKGWEIEKTGDRDISFLLQDFSLSGGASSETIAKQEIPINPMFEVQAKDLEAVFIPDYNQAELNHFKSEVENNAYQELLKLNQEVVRKAFRNKFPETSGNDVELLMKELYKDSGYKYSSITTFGSYKSFCVEFLIGNTVFRRYLVVAYKLAYTIDLCYPEGFPIDDIAAVKEFKKTFYVKAASASYFNFYLRQIFHYGLWIFLIIGGKFIVRYFKGGNLGWS